jgi:hypothetical protein
MRREGQLTLEVDSAAVAHASKDQDKAWETVNVNHVPQRGVPSSSSETVNVNHVPQGGVPRLIHQTFRKKLVVGFYPNPVWEKATDSWRRFFPEGDGPGQFHYQFWTDADLITFFKENCEREAGPLQLAHYRNRISISDIGRYCVLYKLGGIYADLDYEPRTNFYDLLDPEKVNLIESPYKHETVQNSLMASPAGMEYWLNVLRQARLQASEKTGDANDMSGPRLLEGMQATHDPALVHPLPCRQFQRATHSEMDVTKGCGVLDIKSAKEVLGIHWGTLSWRIDGLTGSGRDRSTETASLFRQLFSTLHPVVELDSDRR